MAVAARPHAKLRGVSGGGQSGNQMRCSPQLPLTRRWHRQSERHHQRPRRGRIVRLAGAVLEERVVLRAIVDSTRLLQARPQAEQMCAIEPSNCHNLRMHLHRPLTPARLYAAVRHARFGWRLRWLLRRKRSPQLVQHALHPAQHSLARRFGRLSLPGTEAPLGFLLREDERRPAALHLEHRRVDQGLQDS